MPGHVKLGASGEPDPGAQVTSGKWAKLWFLINCFRSAPLPCGQQCHQKVLYLSLLCFNHHIQHPWFSLNRVSQERPCQAVRSSQSCLDTWWQRRLHRRNHASENIAKPDRISNNRHHFHFQSDDGDKAVVLLGHENKHFKSEQVTNNFLLSLNHFVRLCRLILQNSRSVRTWPTWPSLVRQLSFGIWSRVIRWTSSNYDCIFNSSYRPSWSTPTLASFVWWSIPINAFQSTPTGLKRCTRWLGVCCKGWIFVQGKRREETPPHLWAVTETAYRNMLKDRSVLSGKKLFAMLLKLFLKQ